MDKADLIGRWEIVSWRQEYDDGRVTLPMGEQLAGFIHYTETQMFCVICRAERAPFTTGGQWNAAAEEKARAYDSYLTYAGDYELHGDEIHHKVRYSLFPNWVGAVQKRRARLVDGQLHLTARLEEGTSEARSANLVWRRAQA